MKVIYLVILSLIFQAGTNAQITESKKKFRHIHPKIEELEKIKLMEILDLNEDDMVRFFTRRKEFHENIRTIEGKKDNKLNQLEKSIVDNNSEELKRLIKEISTIDEEMFKLKNEYLTSLSDILNFQQIAKVILFERNFQKELRELILKNRKRRFD